ncbi:MAG: P-II family nitrogen regulator [bacterium]
MKLITAYIQPFMAEKVTDALRTASVRDVTLVACQGFGGVSGEGAPCYLDEGTEFGFANRTKIEILCGDAAVEETIAIIRDHAHTGHQGDGRILVSDVGVVVDIRTGNRGVDIL